MGNGATKNSSDKSVVVNDPIVSEGTQTLTPCVDLGDDDDIPLSRISRTLLHGKGVRRRHLREMQSVRKRMFLPTLFSNVQGKEGHGN